MIRAATVGFLALLTAPASAEQLTGHPRVIDGDTIAFGDARVRLVGIDAPEKAQTCQDQAGAAYRCGLSAAAALTGKIGAGDVRCEGDELDRYGRLLAVCYHGTEDLNGWMVRSGWAFAYRHFSMTYVPLEEAARLDGIGLWRGDAESPWDWRRSH